MTGAWNVAPAGKRDGENGPDQDGKSVADVTRDFPFSLRERDCRTGKTDWKSGKT